ncbi:MAG: hypothetical protein JTT11_10890, partial [Candidatus Brockarchaeota archaeon]|nr:hypothetical protein [Candidatus Brockarchaeota archaeon]
MTQLRKIKSYLTEGEVVFVDPGPEHLPLIHRFNPNFTIRSVPPLPGFIPNLTKTRAIRTGLPKEKLSEVDDEILWQIHADGLAGRLKGFQDSSATLLDVKIELAKRELLACCLCAHLCGVNRILKPGKCGLKERAYVLAPFVHIGEEAVITPAGTIKLFQCALHCAGCQSWEIIHQKEEVMARQGRLLDGTIWSLCHDFEQAATIEFVGGNPDENLLAILQALAEMPKSLWSKPIVWNNHGYTTEVVYNLLDGIVDVYLPDFKGCDPC